MVDDDVGQAANAMLVALLEQGFQCCLGTVLGPIQVEELRWKVALPTGCFQQAGEVRAELCWLGYVTILPLPYNAYRRAPPTPTAVQGERIHQSATA